MTKAAIWLRVSTGEQTTENQLAPLQEYAARRGLEVVTVYDMTGVSARGQQQAALHEVLIRARQGQFTALLCWALDRLTREGAEAFLRVYRQFKRDRLPSDLVNGAVDRDGRPSDAGACPGDYGVDRQDGVRQDLRADKSWDGAR